MEPRSRVTRCRMRVPRDGGRLFPGMMGRADLLILDDWGLAVLTSTERRDLLEILEDRHGRGSTIVTSQLPVEHWHEAIGDPTLAGAILDRLVHNAHRLALADDSMRKGTSMSKTLDPTEKTSTCEHVGQTARGVEWLPTITWNSRPSYVECAPRVL